MGGDELFGELPEEAKPQADGAPLGAPRLVAIDDAGGALERGDIGDSADRFDPPDALRRPQSAALRAVRQ